MPVSRPVACRVTRLLALTRTGRPARDPSDPHAYDADNALLSGLDANIFRFHPAAAPAAAAVTA